MTCQAPLSVGFSRQEYWLGLPFPFPSQGTFLTSGLNPHLLYRLRGQVGSLPPEPLGKLLKIHALPLFAALTETFCLGLCLASQSSMTLCDPMDAGSSVHGNSPGKNTGMGCHFLLQGIFPIQGSNWGLLYYVQIPYCLNHQGSHLAYQFSNLQSSNLTFSSFYDLTVPVLLALANPCHLPLKYLSEHNLSPKWGDAFKEPHRSHLILIAIYILTYRYKERGSKNLHTVHLTNRPCTQQELNGYH